MVNDSNDQEPSPVVTVSGAQDDEQAPLSVTANLPKPEWPPKTVGDLMTRKIIAVLEHEPIGELEAWMKRFRFRHLPVVSRDTKLLGLITQRDFLHAQLGKGPKGNDIPVADAKTQAGAIMRKGVVCAKMDDALSLAGEMMLREKMGCLPVVLEDKTLVGIVTDTDFVRFAVEALKR